MAFKTVAVVGASGTLGRPIVQALLAAGFQVTAISRETSNSTFPDGVEVRRADLSSVASLTKAFAGQDVVVITVPAQESGNQNQYIDAAVAAGVKRLIPAEWGFNTRPGKLSADLAVVLGGKTKTVDYLLQQIKLHPSLTWTGIANGTFLDWGFDHGVYGINLASKTATIYDSGDEPVPASTLPFIAQSVVAVLQRPPEQTANRYYEVVEQTVTQNQLLRLFEEETGAKFDVTRVSTKDLAKVRDEKLAGGDASAFFLVLCIGTFADGARQAVREEDIANGELGLQAKGLREIVREYVKAKGA
ncbi:isoflavone reductase family protein [Parathielavia appendiculata]|uniref:Isoflavone reductase family protein n=1 Tax=Parathielavia appendiculata TaxID=2587402 RepID=A0AAN6TV43_9PEZI|nr:isoflavone reductase family protein [Parathielavia appendiculata]